MVDIDWKVGLKVREVGGGVIETVVGYDRNRIPPQWIRTVDDYGDKTKVNPNTTEFEVVS